MGLKGRDIMSIKQWNSSNSIGLGGVALNLGRSRGWVSTIWEGGEERQYPPLILTGSRADQNNSSPQL
jgi:hypothetical protein